MSEYRLGISGWQLLDVLVHPVVDELDDHVAVLLQHHFVAIAIDADVFQPDEVDMPAGLRDPLRSASVTRAMISAVAREIKDGNSAQAILSQLMHRLRLKRARVLANPVALRLHVGLQVVGLKNGRIVLQQQPVDATAGLHGDDSLHQLGAGIGHFPTHTAALRMCQENDRRVDGVEQREAGLRRERRARVSGVPILHGVLVPYIVLE